MRLGAPILRSTERFYDLNVWGLVGETGDIRIARALNDSRKDLPPAIGDALEASGPVQPGGTDLHLVGVDGFDDGDEFRGGERFRKMAPHAEVAGALDQLGLRFQVQTTACRARGWSPSRRSRGDRITSRTHHVDLAAAFIDLRHDDKGAG